MHLITAFSLVCVQLNTMKSTCVTLEANQNTTEERAHQQERVKILASLLHCIKTGMVFWLRKKCWKNYLLQRMPAFLQTCFSYNIYITIITALAMTIINTVNILSNVLIIITSL